MPSITLTDPVTNTTVASGLIATNNANLRNLLNSGLDYVNLKGAPALVANEAAIWNGTQYVRSSTIGLNLGGTILIGGDTNLYRLSSGALKTDGLFQATLGIYSQGGAGFNYNPATATGNAFTSQVTGNANPLFYVDVNGVMRWGAGGASVTDTDLQRAAANTLLTNSSFIIRGTTSSINWDNQSSAGNNVIQFALSGEANRRFLMTAGGTMQWGAGGASAVDTSLYRSAAATLKTDGRLIATGSVTGATAFQTDWGNGNSGFVLDHLATGYSRVIFATSGGSEFLRIGGAGNGILTWSGDTNLYRSAAGILATDNTLSIGAGVTVPTTNPANKLLITNSTAPTGTPVTGGWLWVEAGALKYKGTSGTVTTIAVA